MLCTRLKISKSEIMNIKSIEEYSITCVDEIFDLIKKLCAIPSPSHHEEQRALFRGKSLSRRKDSQGGFSTCVQRLRVVIRSKERGERRKCVSGFFGTV